MPLSDAAKSFVSAIYEKLDNDYLSTEDHRERYSCILRLQDKYLKTASCVNMVLNRGSTLKGISWDKTGGNEKRACDRCFSARRLCARLRKFGDAGKLVIFPLAEGSRIGKRHDEMAYWVEEKKEEVRYNHMAGYARASQSTG